MPDFNKPQQDLPHSVGHSRFKQKNESGKSKSTASGRAAVLPSDKSTRETTDSHPWRTGIVLPELFGGRTQNRSTDYQACPESNLGLCYPLSINFTDF